MGAEKKNAGDGTQDKALTLDAKLTFLNPFTTGNPFGDKIT